MKSSVGLLLLLSPLVAADEDVRTVELLRLLSKGQNSWTTDPTRLSQHPEILLDIIFTPENADASPPETLRKAEKWIRRLGEEAYSDREEATRNLGTFGPEIRPALEEGGRNPDPEIRHRSKRILDQLKDRPPVTELDYAKISHALRRILEHIGDDATLEHLARQCLRRIGHPTAHGQEDLLAKQVFFQLMVRGTRGAPAIVRRTLTTGHRGLRTSVAFAIAEASGGKPPGPILLDGLASGDPEVLDILLIRLPDVKEGGDAVEAYRKALRMIASRKSLPESTRLAASRSLLSAFHDAGSLRTLLEASHGEHADLAVLALTDPRLPGIALDGASRAADLIAHPSAEVRRAAGVFLLTRPGREERRRGLAFLPHLGQAGEKELEKLWAGLDGHVDLREDLEALADEGGRTGEIAWRLLDFLPMNFDLLAPPPDKPFGF